MSAGVSISGMAVGGSNIPASSTFIPVISVETDLNGAQSAEFCYDPIGSLIRDPSSVTLPILAVDGECITVSALPPPALSPPVVVSPSPPPPPPPVVGTPIQIRFVPGTVSVCKTTKEREHF